MAEFFLIGSLLIIAAGMTVVAVYAYFGHYWYRWRHRDDAPCLRCRTGCDGNCQADWCGAVENVRYH